MANQVVVSPGVYTSEKDLSFVASSVGITRLGMAGETYRGPANQPIFVGDYDTYKTYFGPQKTEQYCLSQPCAAGSTKHPRYEATYIARAYLSESNNLWTTRILGSTGYDATEGLVINLGIGTTNTGAAGQQVQSTRRLSATTACVIRARKYYGASTFNQPNIHIGVVPTQGFDTYANNAASPTYAANGFMIGGSGTAGALIAGGAWANATGDFTIAAKRQAFAGVGAADDRYLVSFNPNSNNYITKVLGTNPYYDQNNPDQRLYVEQIYINAVKQMGKEWGGSAANNYLDVIEDMSFFNLQTTWKNYTDTWQPTATPDGPQTPWIYSEVRGTEIVKLFRLILISDGDTANDFLKFSILNIDIDNKTFDIAIRAYGDSDAKQVIYEQYKNISLNPISQNYIGKKIGTLNGEYALRSRYIMVDIDENCPVDAVPAGYEGYPTTNSSGNFGNLSGRTQSQGTGAADGLALHSRVEPFAYYNVSYDLVADNIRKTYLGLGSKMGWDQDMFDYHGCATNGTNSGGDRTLCAAAWSGKTYGFHMDTRASGSTFLQNTNAGDYRVWFSGSVGTFPFYATSSQYTVNGYYGPNSSNSATSAKNVYYNKKYRKFTVFPYGGHDGWEPYRSVRSNTDLWKENATYYTAGYGSGATAVAASGDFQFNKTSDWYAFQTAIHKFANPEETDINLFASPGIDYTNNLTLVNDTIEMVEDDRADSLYIVTSQNYKDQGVENAVDALDDADINSNYVATYWPWIQYNDTENNVRLYLPPTCEVLRNMAITDNVAFPWFATAGYNRGIVKANKVRKNLTQDDRDDLYEARINPIATFTATGPVIWGNKTLQTAMSALDRINVRRLLLRARKLVSAVAVRLIFEQNDEIVRQEFLSLVNPILEDIRRDRGLTDFKVVLSNDPEEIDQNKLTGKIFIKPTRSLEFIEIEFNITPTATSFDDI